MQKFAIGWLFFHFHWKTLDISFDADLKILYRKLTPIRRINKYNFYLILIGFKNTFSVAFVLFPIVANTYIIGWNILLIFNTWKNSIGKSRVVIGITGVLVTRPPTNSWCCIVNMCHKQYALLTYRLNIVVYAC